MVASESREFWRIEGPSIAATLGMLTIVTAGYYWPVVSFGPLIGAIGLLAIIGAVVVDVRRGPDAPQRKTNVIVHSGMFVLSLLIYALTVAIFCFSQ